MDPLPKDEIYIEVETFIIIARHYLFNKKLQMVGGQSGCSLAFGRLILSFGIMCKKPYEYVNLDF